MKILIVSATIAEIKPLANILKLTLHNDTRLYHAKYNNHEIIILITGVGMVATAFHIGCIEANKFDMALNVGIAGSFNKAITIGEVVNVASDCFAELGADYGDTFVPLYNLDFATDFQTVFMNKNGEIINNESSSNQVISGLKNVKGITVNTINGNAERIEKVQKHFSPDVESMEGAAFMYACMLKEIPCFQIRSISNYIEPRNLNNWNIPLAIGKVNKRLVEIIDAYADSKIYS
ncbi:MAG: futalosine hydrolase [Bacteroidota bacterium]